MVEFDRAEFKKWMKLLDYTQKDLIPVINHVYGYQISYSNLSKAINGHTNFTLHLALIIVDILEVPMEQLFTVKKIDI